MSQYELLRPRQLEQIIARAPVAYIPLGTLEFHGWHLPLGFDALKAHALCLRAQALTGGVVLPPSYFGFEGGHRDYTGSIISEEAWVLGNLNRTFERLAAMGFRVLVALTGHYPWQQMAAVKAAADAFTSSHPDVTAIGLAEPQAYPGEFRGDHAAKWETSLALELTPELTSLADFDEEADPMCGICGEDPRQSATKDLGRETVEKIVETIVTKVNDALSKTA